MTLSDSLIEGTGMGQAISNDFRSRSPWPIDRLAIPCKRLP